LLVVGHLQLNMYTPERFFLVFFVSTILLLIIRHLTEPVKYSQHNNWKNDSQNVCKKFWLIEIIKNYRKAAKKSPKNHKCEKIQNSSFKIEFVGIALRNPCVIIKLKITHFHINSQRWYIIIRVIGGVTTTI